MSFRTVTINSCCKLETRIGYLIVRYDEEKQVLISEISTLIINSTSVSLTAALLTDLIKNKVNVIFCDEKHIPLFYLNPFSINYTSSKRIQNQIKWTSDSKEKLWKNIISNKIFMQAKILKKYGFNKEYNMLQDYLNNVEDGDVTNREGHASKVYFGVIFGENFSRSTKSKINDYLNYGYSIVLSDCSRAIAEYGYINQIGVWHRNEYNELNLACDVMEPFRPLVDDFIIRMGIREDFKLVLPQINTIRVFIDESFQYLENAIKIYFNNLTDFLENDKEYQFIDKYLEGENEF